MATGFAHYRYGALFLLLLAALWTPAVADSVENRDNKPFLAASTSSSVPFVGEEIVLTYTLYFRDVAPKILSEFNPSLQGFWAKEATPERFIKSREESVQGERWRSAVVKQFRLAPVQSGRLAVSGYNMQCLLPHQQVSAVVTEQPDIRVRITAPAVIITARSIPDPVPDGFSGGVGSFSINLLPDRQRLRAGEPLTLKLILTGTGSLHTLQLPRLHLPESFRQNPPDKILSLNKGTGVSSGSITSTITAWPQSEGEFQIPALRLVVFNPVKKQFSTLLSNPIMVSVVAAKKEMAGETAAPPRPAPDDRSLLPGWAAIAIALLLVGAALLVARKKQIKRAGGVEALAGLPPESEQSAGTMKQQLIALLEEAGIKCPGALTRRELKSALMNLNMTDEARADLPAVLDSLDKRLYSPAGKKEGQLPARVVARVSTLVDALKKAVRTR
jgi:hypothetical protein